MATLIGVVMVLGGILVIVFRRRAANFIRETDARVLEGRRNPLGASSPPSILASGLGLVVLGLWILWKSFQ
jgi:hypothetical protein